MNILGPSHFRKIFPSVVCFVALGTFPKFKIQITCTLDFCTYTVF